jgi:hypothetical protein
MSGLSVMGLPGKGFFQKSAVTIVKLIVSYFQIA